MASLGSAANASRSTVVNGQLGVDLLAVSHIGAEGELGDGVQLGSEHGLVDELLLLLVFVVVAHPVNDPPVVHLLQDVGVLHFRPGTHVTL